MILFIFFRKMLIIYLLFVILILIITYLLIKSISSKKIIWQKISFLYNKIYKILILDYYKEKKNKKFKEEVIDYYKNVVHTDNIFNKFKNWDSIKDFIKLYYKNADNADVKIMIDSIDFLTLKYYKSISYNINVLLFILAICVTMLIVLLIN